MHRWPWAVGLACALAWSALAPPASAQLEPRPSNSPTPFRSPTPLPTLLPLPTLAVVSLLTPTPTVGSAATLAGQDAPAAATARPAEAPAPHPGGAIALDDLSAVVLTEADVPRGLRPEPRLSGPVEFPGIRGQTAGFMVDAAAGAAPLLAASPIVMVVSAVQVFDDEELRRQGLDAVAQGAQMGARLVAEAAGGTATDLSSELPAPPVGVESRAFAIRAGAGSETVTTTFVVFRREAVFASVVVAAMGTEPVLSEATRLAQIMDGRLLALGVR